MTNVVSSVIPHPTTIEITRGSSPLVRLSIFRVDDGQEIPYDFLGANSLRFYVKADPDDPDTGPLYEYPGAISFVGEPSNGVVSIQFDGTQHSAAGNWFFRLDAHKGSPVSTVAYGQFHVTTG